MNQEKHRNLKEEREYLLIKWHGHKDLTYGECYTALVQELGYTEPEARGLMRDWSRRF